MSRHKKAKQMLGFFICAPSLCLVWNWNSECVSFGIYRFNFGRKAKGFSEDCL